MPWMCECGSNNANLNSSCAICKKVRIGELECFDDSEYLQIKVICYYTRLKEYNMPMTESEKLFAKFFAEEKVLVADMDDLTLRSHREELSKIAFEARARLTAIGDEVQGRTSKKNKVFNSPSEESVGDTINKINERKTKMSKVDKQIENMVAMGIDRETAEKMFAASSISEIKKTGKVTESKEKTKQEVLSSLDGICPECKYDFGKKSGINECPECKSKVNIIKTKEAKPKPVNNPFLVLTEVKADTVVVPITYEEVKIEEEIVELVKETIEEGIKPTPGNTASFNPFAKK